MKYLIISELGISLFLVPRLNKIAEVEEIYYCILDMNMKHLAAGMENLPDWSKLKVVTDPFAALNKAPKESWIVVIDDVEMGYIGDHLRKDGYKVIGGASMVDKLEGDRTFATDLCSRIMEVPETFTFKSFKEGLNFLKTRDKADRFCFKPCDSAVPKEYTYLARDIQDMVESMQSFQSGWLWKEEYQLQVFVKGVETDFSAYFNGKDFIENSMIIYFENKPYMNDDIGPATGGAVAVEFARPPDEIFWPILQKMKPYLIKANYQGQISMNSIVSEEDKKPYFLEFCGRFGYPSFPLDISLVEENGHTVHELFKAMVEGRNAKELFPKDKISTCIEISVPPTPFGGKAAVELIKGQEVKWDKKYDRYFFPYGSLMWEEKKGMVLSGTSADVLILTSCDSTLQGALENMYDKYVKSLRLRNMLFRSDCGTSGKERISKLKSMKLI